MAWINEYSEDSVIVSEGQQSTHMYMVIEGAVALYMNYGKDNEYVLGICGKNKSFGEISAISNDSSIYTAVAFNDVKCMVFDSDELDSFIHRYPDQAMGILKNMAMFTKNLRKSLQMLIDDNADMAEKWEIYKNVVKTSFRRF